MRHKYETPALVLTRTPIGEAALLVTILTPEFGLVRARAEGLRRPGAKLAHALQTLDECDVILVRGKEGWRLSGAVLVESWFQLLDHDTRSRVGRIAGLLLRLVHGESTDPELFVIVMSFVKNLQTLPTAAQDTAECYVALKILAHLGLDAGPLPSMDTFEPLSDTARRDLVLRINRGIVASGL